MGFHHQQGEPRTITKTFLVEAKQMQGPLQSPRPRAVLSSPDNDQMIRTRGKTKAELISGLKSRNSCQNRHHTRCKTFPKSIQAENPTSGNKDSKETADAKLDPRARGRLVTADRSQKAHIHEGDQDSVCSK